MELINKRITPGRQNMSPKVRVKSKMVIHGTVIHSTPFANCATIKQILSFPDLPWWLHKHKICEIYLPALTAPPNGFPLETFPWALSCWFALLRYLASFHWQEFLLPKDWNVEAFTLTGGCSGRSENNKPIAMLQVKIIAEYMIDLLYLWLLAYTHKNTMQRWLQHFNTRVAH